METIKAKENLSVFEAYVTTQYLIGPGTGHSHGPRYFTLSVRITSASAGVRFLTSGP